MWFRKKKKKKPGYIVLDLVKILTRKINFGY